MAFCMSTKARRPVLDKKAVPFSHGGVSPKRRRRDQEDRSKAVQQLDLAIHSTSRRIRETIEQTRFSVKDRKEIQQRFEKNATWV